MGGDAGAGGGPSAAAIARQQAELEQQNKRIQTQRIGGLKRGSGASQITPIFPTNVASGKPGSAPNAFGTATGKSSLFNIKNLGG